MPVVWAREPSMGDAGHAGWEGVGLARSCLQRREEGE